MIIHLSKLRSTIYMCLIIYWIFFDILECDYKMSMQFNSHVESPERVFHLPGVCMDLCMVAATLAPCWHHARSLDQDTAGKYNMQINLSTISIAERKTSKAFKQEFQFLSSLCKSQS